MIFGSPFLGEGGVLTRGAFRREAARPHHHAAESRARVNGDNTETLVATAIHEAFHLGR